MSHFFLLFVVWWMPSITKHKFTPNSVPSQNNWYRIGKSIIHFEGMKGIAKNKASIPFK